MAQRVPEWLSIYSKMRLLGTVIIAPAIGMSLMARAMLMLDSDTELNWRQLVKLQWRFVIFTPPITIPSAAALFLVSAFSIFATFMAPSERVKRMLKFTRISVLLGVGIASVFIITGLIAGIVDWTKGCKPLMGQGDDADGQSGVDAPCFAGESFIVTQYMCVFLFGLVVIMWFHAFVLKEYLDRLAAAHERPQRNLDEKFITAFIGLELVFMLAYIITNGLAYTSCNHTCDKTREQCIVGYPEGAEFCDRFSAECHFGSCTMVLLMALFVGVVLAGLIVASFYLRYLHSLGTDAGQRAHVILEQGFDNMDSDGVPRQSGASSSQEAVSRFTVDDTDYDLHLDDEDEDEHL